MNKLCDYMLSCYERNIDGLFSKLDGGHGRGHGGYDGDGWGDGCSLCGNGYGDTGTLSGDGMSEGEGFRWTDD